MKEIHYLFSYGSLQDEKVQLRIFQRRLKGTTAILNGYRLIENEHLGTFPVIYPSPKQSDTVNGLVFEVTEAELHYCDDYETNYYKRVKVDLNTHPPAWVYVRNSD